ncbi:MAG TPA: S8 family serine peptidase [Solirubrobacteraceae bacterium]|nr:S8 family serine peptidase [Solirubrobacteraceae bacterium]
MRGRSRLLAVVVAATAMFGLLQVLSTSASATDQTPTQRVIVVFRNQDPGQPATRADLGARRNSFHATQSPVISQMSSSGAHSVQSYNVIDAVAATVSKSEESTLKSNSAVQEVVPDQVIHLAPITPAESGGASGGSSAPASSVCAPNGKVQLDPQALETINADSDQPGAKTARSLGIDGSGVTVGFIADGLDIDNPDFIRPDGQHVFVDYKDFSGEGTGVATGGEEAFGDASSIAAQGNEVYNAEGYGPHAVTTPCKFRIEGVAPGASLVGLDIFGAEDAGYNSSFLNAINYAVTADHVNVLNESLGNNYYPDDSATLDLIKQANDAAVAAGTTVTVSSGDAGVTSTIGTPSTDPDVISAGATTTYRIDLQDGYGGAQFPGIKGYLNNNISSFSSGGFEQSGRTVDVVAPGELNWALCSTDTAMYGDCTNYANNPTPFLAFGGTSESSPLTAGVAALVIQAYEKTHSVAPSPAVVKQIIAGTSTDIGSPADQQGSGLVNAYQAVLAAESYKAPASAPKPVGSTVLESSTQLNAVDAPGTPETLTDTITNNGASRQAISLSTRALGAYQTIDTAKVVLSDSSSPKTTDWAGVPSNYEPVTFHVPAGENRLNASLAFVNASTTDLNARVRLTLVDPNGDLAGYSVPQGDGNYGNIQVTNPQPGTWTAYAWSKEASQGGTNGPVLFGAQVAKYTTFGSVSPHAVVLNPGQSAPATLRVTTPSTPGDSAGAIVLNGSSGTATIPVTLRSLIPAGNHSFSQTLTGGNGRSAITGETFYYQLDVPSGEPELNADIALADNPNNPFTAYLISPSGEAVAQSANELAGGNFAAGLTETNDIGAQLHVLSPAPGAWTLIVAFIPQVSGTALSEPFTVSTSQRAVPASAGGLPDSTGTRLPAGKAQTDDVRITNNGPAPEEYFIDARQSGSAQLSLTSVSTPDTTVPLTDASNFPVYLLPTDSTAFTATASTTGSTPIEFDSEGPSGDPDIGSTVGSSVVGDISAPELSPGEWDVAPDVVGAFGSMGAPQEPVDTTMTATTAPFDPAVSSQTGDLWLASTDPSTLAGFSPITVGPGQSATIPVTITPTGPSGTTDSGTLYIDDTDLFLFQNILEPTGDQVAALPYSYTVK